MGPQKSGTENDSTNNNADFNCSVNLKNIFSPNNYNEVLQTSCVNDINSNIFRCKIKQCQFQLDFYSSEKFVSFITKMMYDCRFSLEYVGKTLQKLKEVFNLHKKGLRSKR